MCIAIAQVALALMYASDKANNVFVLDHGVQRDRCIDHFEIIIKVYSSKVDVFKQPFSLFFSYNKKDTIHHSTYILV